MSSKYDFSDYMEFYLVREPASGTRLSGAFDAVDQAFGSAPFSSKQGVKAITNVMAISDEEAEELFNDLIKGECIA